LRLLKTDGRTETKRYGNTVGDKHTGGGEAAAATAAAKSDNASTRTEEREVRIDDDDDLPPKSIYRAVLRQTGPGSGRGREGMQGRVRGGKTICAGDEDARQIVILC